MSTHVFIGTTQGPVAVQRITREDSGVQSVVCLNGTVEALPISAAYHDFVRRGTGLVARDFGHDAYRVDLAARIDQGVSWQLPLYLAHALAAQDALGNGEPQAGDTVLWATGEVGADGSVRPVARTADKLQRSLATIAQWREQGVAVRVLLPDANLGESAGQIADLAGVAGVRMLTDALVGLAEPTTPRSAGSSPAAGMAARLRRPRILVAALVLVFVPALLLWLWPREGGPQEPTASEIIVLDDFGGQVQRPARSATQD